MKLAWSIFGAALMIYSEIRGQYSLPLYPADHIPNSRPCDDQEFQDTTETGILIVHQITRPTLTVFLPDPAVATRTAMIVCPGGGYKINALAHEGLQVGQQLAAAGITAFVLKYRIPDNQSMLMKEIGPWQDLQRAIQMVREGAGHWGVHPDKIGVMGFSAGGHLASTQGTRWQEEHIFNPAKTSLKPNFLALIYPVISFSDTIGHAGSRENLLGNEPTAEKVRYFSNELWVNTSTPPTFLAHAKDDGISVGNSQVFAEALNAAGIPHRLLLFESGGHGFGMINPKSDKRWMDELLDWMIKMKLY